jgi:hypothetical protein
MTSVHPGPGPTDPRPTSDRPVSLVERILYPEWGPIVAGGIAAAALALVLHAFALAIGLSVSRRHRRGGTRLLHLCCCRHCTWSWQRSRPTGWAVT